MVEYVEPANLTGKQESIDFSKVYWDTVEINTVFMTATEDVLEKARTEEYKKLSFWDVFEEIQDIGQQKIKSRWVYSEKNNGKVKARLVARGFEDVERSNLVKNSLTCSRDTFRAFLAVASTMSKWIFGSLDVKVCFYRAHLSKKSVILQPLKELRRECFAWKLKKSLNGLVDTPRMWYLRVRDFLEETARNQSLIHVCSPRETIREFLELWLFMWKMSVTWGMTVLSPL